jgi:ribA/ribD-fused uncharacterized protein
MKNKHTLDALITAIHENKQIEFQFFWGHTPQKEGVIDKSCLSQWYPADFVVDEVQYQSAEQYMMARKAALFEDQEIQNKILATNDPEQAKALGRQVKGFDKKIWEAHRQEIVFQGNLAKFRQNEALEEYLLSTGDQVLVEASPEDRIWGIGNHATHADADNPEKWKGLNLLGFILMDVRSVLRENSFE